MILGGGRALGDWLLINLKIYGLIPIVQRHNMQFIYLSPFVLIHDAYYRQESPLRRKAVIRQTNSMRVANRLAGIVNRYSSSGFIMIFSQMYISTN